MKEIKTDQNGLILLFRKKPSKKRDFWQLDTVEKRYTDSILRLTCSDTSYYFRCPYCGLLQGSSLGVTVSVGKAKVKEDPSDCIICFRGCGRHYFVRLRGMRKAVGKALEKREAR